MRTKTEKSRRAIAEAEDSPTAWFVVLERSLAASDFERAAAAKRQLARLGISVAYPARWKAVRDAR